jgi:hypothetical protein
MLDYSIRGSLTYSISARFYGWTGICVKSMLYWICPTNGWTYNFDTKNALVLVIEYRIHI